MRTLVPVSMVVALLAACGGGAEAPSSRPQALALRAPAAAAAASAPTAEEAATQLMDFGEAAYPQYFPAHGSDLDARPDLPFVYRYYAQTGIYLGVAMPGAAGYVADGVYVMGGPFGNAPRYVGLLADFITPVAPRPSNGCFDQLLSMAQTAGSRLVVSYAHSGAASGSSTVDTRVTGPASFEGVALVETVARTAPGSFETGIPEGQGSEARSYDLRSGPAQLTRYGGTGLETATDGAATLTLSTRIVNSPAVIERYFSLAVGESLSTGTAARTTTTTTVVLPGSPTQIRSESVTVARSQTYRFLRREPLTVPAGQFATCVYQLTGTQDGSPQPASTLWVADGKGIPVRMETGEGASLQVRQAATIRVDGVAVVN